MFDIVRIPHGPTAALNVHGQKSALFLVTLLLVLGKQRSISSMRILKIRVI